MRRQSARRVWYRAGYANEREGCNLLAKITGGLVVTTVAFGRADQPGALPRSDDGSVLPPVAYSAVARPALCARWRGRGHGYHWGSVQMRRIDWPFSMAALGELHDATIARVLAGEVPEPLLCAQCQERAQERACTDVLW